MPLTKAHALGYSNREASYREVGLGLWKRRMFGWITRTLGGERVKVKQMSWTVLEVGFLKPRSTVCREVTVERY